MNTLTHIPMLQVGDHRDNVILLEDKEFCMSKAQLERITKKHNDGYTLEEISESEKRDHYEVIIALLHQAQYKKLTRPFGARQKGFRSG